MELFNFSIETIIDSIGLSKRLNLGGLLAIHDVFPNPEDGGRPPYNIYLKALESGKFQEIEFIKSLCLLKKVD